MKYDCEEYRALRQEILNAIGYIRNYDMLLYSVTGVILTFAFRQNEPLIFLTPIVVIIPTYLLSMSQIKSMLRIGAYILVFYENGNPGWETHLAMFDCDFSPKNPSISPHVFISFCSFILCMFQLDYTKYKSVFFISRMASSVVFLLICLLVILLNQVKYKEAKMKYICYWKKIKFREEMEL